MTLRHCPRGLLDQNVLSNENGTGQAKRFTVFSAAAVRDPCLALMALIHPLCELRLAQGGGDTICTVAAQNRRSLLMASVSDGAAEAVIPNNMTSYDVLYGVENLAISLDRWRVGE